MKKLYSAAIITLSLFLFYSCSNKDKKAIDYLAVKLIGSEAYSIIDVNTGELKYKNEFVNEPSAIMNDIFSVKNGNGTYDFYNINNVKTPLNKESYIDVIGSYHSDVFPVTKKGKPISLIDQNCKEIAVLDASISTCYNFNDNLAVFRDLDDKFGFINKKGEIVIRAQYDTASSFFENIAICSIKDTANDKETIYAIDKKGNELFSFDANEYSSYGRFRDGILPVIKDNEVIYLNKKGEKLYSLCNTNKDSYGYEVYSCTSLDGRSVFVEGNLYGLKDSKNNIILRAKYNSLSDIGNDKYIATKNDKYGVVDFKDNVIIDFKYDKLYNIKKGIYLAGSDQSITLIDEQGKDKSRYNFLESQLTPDYTVKSNYIDPKAYAIKLSSLFTTKTFLNYHGGLKVKDFKSELGAYPSTYEDTPALEIDKYSDSPTVVWFASNIARETFSYFYGYSFHDDWVFNYDSKISGVGKIYNISEYDSIEDSIAKEFDNILEERGYTLKNGTSIYECADGTAVNLSYKDGLFTLYYYFNQGRYIDSCREAREKKSLATPQGIDKKNKPQQDSVKQKS